MIIVDTARQCRGMLNHVRVRQRRTIYQQQPRPRPTCPVLVVVQEAGKVNIMFTKKIEIL